MRHTFVLLALTPSMLSAQEPQDTTRVRRDTARALEAVTVSAIRSRADAPVSARLLTAPEIERRSFGQDIPLLLQGTPSVTSYSETGNYWGYSYIRMRGIDQSRINLTLDGIPLNDPEDQVLYFADFPDLANSIGSIQIQRGVGTSAPGAASYGGSINFETLPLGSARRAGELQVQGGSFGSARASAEYASGRTSGGLAVYGRLSAIRTQGFRRHSGAEGRSGFVGVAYVGDRDALKFTGLVGHIADTLAYLGASASELAQDRRFNPLRRDEVDRFGEQLAALSYTRLVSARSSASATVYRISASGNYDVCVNNCGQPQGDLWNFTLDFAWYGVTTAWTYERERLRASVGANANTYARDHSAFARPDFGRRLYANTGHKKDAGMFAKLAYDVGRVTLFGDVQGRRAAFSYTADPASGVSRPPISWLFVNPKVGATLRVASGLEAYASYGINSREPARSDMLGGFDNIDQSNDAFVGPFDRVRPERAHDTEAGVRYRTALLSIDANAFAMEFRNEILPVGQLSYIGTPLRTNVRSSWRRGVEAEVIARLTAALSVDVVATAMRGNIDGFTDDNTGLDYANVEPLLTPTFVTSHRISFTPTRALSATIAGQYTSRSQLSNTGDATLALPASYIASATADWTFGVHGVSLHVNNVANSRRFASGHVSGGEARYYVLPPLNAFLIVRIGL